MTNSSSLCLRCITNEYTTGPLYDNLQRSKVTHKPIYMLHTSPGDHRRDAIRSHDNHSALLWPHL